MSVEQDPVSGGEPDPQIAAGVADISSSLFGEPDPTDLGGEEGDSDAAAPAEGQSEAEGVAETQEVSEAAPPETENQEPAADGPPKTWSKDAAAEWAKLPPRVQQEIQKREADIFKGIEQYREAATVGKSYQEVLKPYERELQMAGVDPVEMFRGFAFNHYKLSMGTPAEKAQIARNLINHYGIDINQLAGGDTYTPTAEDYVDPEIKQLKDEINALKSTTIERQRAEAQDIVAKFASDPAHQYFNEVQNDMARLLQTGIASDLEDAYQKAVRLNATVAEKEAQRLATEREAQRQAEEKQRLDKAKASVRANVATRPSNRSAAAPIGTIDDTMNSVLADIRQRA